MPKHDHLHSLPIVDLYPEEVWAAMNYAARAHEKQRRKLSGNHYIEHPFGVLELVREVTADVATQQAAILHDTVEDTDVTLDDLRRDFGDETATIVWGVTKDDSIEGWRPRNEAYLERLANQAPDGSVIVALADKIHNITDMIDSFIEQGDDMWANFSANPVDQLWWYSSVLEIGRARLPDCPLVAALEERIAVFRRIVLGRQAYRVASFGA